MLLLATDVSGTQPLTGPPGWAPVSSNAGTAISTAAWSRVATATDAGQPVTVGFGGTYKGGIQLLAYSGTSATAPVLTFASAVTHTTTSSAATPPVNITGSGNWVVSYWAAKSSAVSAWTLTAGEVTRSTSYGTGGGRIDAIAGDAGAPAPAGPARGLTATQISYFQPGRPGRSCSRPARDRNAAPACAGCAGTGNFAQDLTQLTFIKVYLSWRRIRHEDPYWYGKKVLLRTYLDHKRLKSSAELQTDALPERPAAADAAELRLTLLDALGHLGSRDRAIIVLRYWEDHSVQTVAELLGLSPGVVKVRSMRALARLRVLVGEDEAPSAQGGALTAAGRCAETHSAARRPANQARKSSLPNMAAVSAALG